MKAPGRKRKNHHNKPVQKVKDIKSKRKSFVHHSTVKEFFDEEMELMGKDWA